MGLRGKLLIYFFTIILIVMVVFGLIAYQIAYDSAVKKELYLLADIVDQQRILLAKEYQENPTLERFLFFMLNSPNSNHAVFLADSRGRIVVPEKLSAIFGRYYGLFNLDKMLIENSAQGRINLGDEIYLWATGPVEGSPYKILHIFHSSYKISEPFASLAARLVVSAIIILWVAVWVALIIATAVSRRFQSQTDALEYQATHDGLTDLPNRILLQLRLNQAIIKAKRKKESLALIIMDLDRFKEINDTLGHQIGDQVLKQLSSRLRKVLVAPDMVARLGGDEFALLLPTADQSRALCVVNEILDCVSQPFTTMELSMEIEASLGIALYPEHGTDATSLMRHADTAMYLAKSGDDIYAVYKHEKDPHSVRRLTLMGELRQAIERDELCLYFQPKIDIKSGQVLGAESLIRWQHPRYGLMLPSVFIPLAEQTGMIKPLTFWVLEKAICECTVWQRAGHKITVSTNMSPRMLTDIRVPAEIASLLKSQGLRANLLEVELTETAIMNDPLRAREILTQLDEMGVQLSIDDFGTGYTSMAYLKQLPVDAIKIDKSFVINMLRDRDDATIVRSIIDLAHNMGHIVIAEGVENRQTYEVLAELFCDIVQGDYMSRALPAVEFSRWLDETPWLATKLESRS